MIRPNPVWAGLTISTTSSGTLSTPVPLVSNRDPYAYQFPLLEGCSPQGMNVCGVNYTVPQGIPGTIFSYNLPGRFANPAFSVQCALGSAAYGYFVVDTSTNAAMAPLCALKSCTPASVDVCDQDFIIDAETQANDVLQLVVPQHLLEPLNGRPEPIFSVQCVGDGDITHYVVTDHQQVKCSNFLCPPTTLPVCGASVTIDQSAATGAVLHTATINEEPVTVSCLASSGDAPAYQVTDHECR